MFQLINLLTRINPVTGCYEANKPNPMEGMTEEEKEYEAMKLVNMIDKLQRFVNLTAGTNFMLTFPTFSELESSSRAKLEKTENHILLATF